MAKSKIDGILLGKGGLTSNTTSSQVFSSTVPMSTWSAGTSYSVDSMVEYSGALYRSLVNTNVGNTPSSTPADWELYSTVVKDGDVAVIVAGILSDVMIRQNTRWISLIGVPIQGTLSDNLASQLFLSIPLAVASGATIEYTVQRGGNFRRGTLRYESDGTVSGTRLTDANNVDTGADVGVTWDASVDAGPTNVQLFGTTDSQATPAIVKYTLRGWT